MATIKSENFCRVVCLSTGHPNRLIYSLGAQTKQIKEIIFELFGEWNKIDTYIHTHTQVT